MSTNAQMIMAPYIALREKNLAFFKNKFPDLYTAVSQHKMQNAHINIDTEQNSLNLIKNHQAMYKDGAEKYVEKEVALFLNTYSTGKPVISLNGPSQYTYFYPRFFNRQATELIKKIAIKRDAH